MILLTRTALNVQSLVLAVIPHGGQRSARRNAWASMSTDAARARSRRDADRAMDRAVDRAVVRASVRGTAMAQHPAAQAR